MNYTAVNLRIEPIYIYFVRPTSRILVILLSRRHSVLPAVVP